MAGTMTGTELWAAFDAAAMWALALTIIVTVTLVTVHHRRHRNDPTPERVGLAAFFDGFDTEETS